MDFTQGHLKAVDMELVQIDSYDDLCNCTAKPLQDLWQEKNLSCRMQKRRIEVVTQLLSNLNVKNHLDIGCAEGFITSKLESLFPEVVGTDIDISYLRTAHSRTVRTQFILSSISDLPFADQSIDSISILEVIEHLPMKLIKQGLLEIDRILRNYGVLLISTPYRQNIKFLVCPACGKLRPTNEAWHLHGFDENSITSLLPDGYRFQARVIGPNFSIISCSKALYLLPLNLWLPLNSILGLMRKGDFIISKYQKTSD